MTSRMTRQPSPPPTEDTRIPSPARDASPPAPNRTSPRHDAPEIPPVDVDSTRPTDISTEPATFSVNPNVSTEPFSAAAVSIVTPSPAEDVHISAPSATVTPLAPKDAAPIAEVSAPTDASSKTRKVVVIKASSSQKGLAGSSQPSIADVLRKGAASAKASVAPAASTQLALHKSPAAAVVTQHVRGKVLTRTASGNSLGSLVEYANNWNAADQFEGNPGSHLFQLSDISSRLHQGAKIVLESDKMNEVIAFYGVLISFPDAIIYILVPESCKRITCYLFGSFMMLLLS